MASEEVLLTFPTVSVPAPSVGPSGLLAVVLRPKALEANRIRAVSGAGLAL
jgi:hypothetical protein